MKKLFLLSVLALVAMTMNAQIVLEATFNDGAFPLTACYKGLDGNEQFRFCGALDNTGRYLSLYDADNAFSLYKIIDLGSTGYGEEDILFPAKNFYTTDGKVAFILYQPNKTILMDEDGIERQIISNIKSYMYILKVRDKYKIFDLSEYKIYGIPGNDTPTDIESPSTSIRKSNVQKVVENGQMYIILDGVKYAVTGAEM